MKAVCLLLATLPVAAQQGPVSPTPIAPIVGATGPACTTLDFEGLANHEALTTLGSSPSATFTNFRALIDTDAGGSAPVANEPSGETVAYITADPAMIEFDIPVGHVSIYGVADTSILPYQIWAWSGPGGTGTLLNGTVGFLIGRASQGSSCTGDPTGDFCAWEAMAMQSGTNNIKSLTFSPGLANLVAFDDLNFCQITPIYQSYCSPAVPNSTGNPATLVAVGSTFVHDEDFFLYTYPLAPNQPGMLLNSLTQGMVQPPTSSGILCLGGQIGRHSPTASFTNGVLFGSVDFWNFPTPGGPHVVLPGETWNFQVWYRDLGNTSNFSDACTVTFQ